MARRIESKGAGDCLGRYPPGWRQAPGRGIYGKPGDAVVSAVADIEEFPRSGEMDLRAGVGFAVPVGQRRDGLRGREGAGRRVEPVGRDAAALLVGEIDEIPGGMKTIVARPGQLRRLDPLRRISS